MIVLDASAVVDLLLDLPPWGDVVADRVAAEGPALAAPHLLDAEVGQVLRRFTLGGRITPARAEGALDDLAALPITHYGHAMLARRAFDLRDNVTVYDALYLVLAETLASPLVTRDAALAQVPGHRAVVEVIGA